MCREDCTPQPFTAYMLGLSEELHLTVIKSLTEQRCSTCISKRPLIKVKNEDDMEQWAKVYVDAGWHSEAVLSEEQSVTAW